MVRMQLLSVLIASLHNALMVSSSSKRTSSISHEEFDSEFDKCTREITV